MGNTINSWRNVEAQVCVRPRVIAWTRVYKLVKTSHVCYTYIHHIRGIDAFATPSFTQEATLPLGQVLERRISLSAAQRSMTLVFDAGGSDAIVADGSARAPDMTSQCALQRSDCVAPLKRDTLRLQ